jgi:hypothetical protein
MTPDDYRALVIAHALELYARTGLKANTAYTPTAMIRAARQITGKPLKTRDYIGAAQALRQHLGGQDALS